MSGHADFAPHPEYLKRGKLFEAIGALQNSPEVESSPGQSKRRRLSQAEEDFNVVMRQNSGNSNKMLNLSDEGNASKKESKSAFSETASNPDLDEIFFNKHTPGSS